MFQNESISGSLEKTKDKMNRSQEVKDKYPAMVIHEALSDNLMEHQFKQIY